MLLERSCESMHPAGLIIPGCNGGAIGRCHATPPGRLERKFGTVLHVAKGHFGPPPQLCRISWHDCCPGCSRGSASG